MSKAAERCLELFDQYAAASRASSGENFGNPALESIRNQFIESLDRLKMAYNGHVTAPFKK